MAKELMAASKDEPMGDEEAVEPEYDEGEAMKEAFLEMCKAIRKGDDESAFSAYQECMGKGG